MKKLILNLKLLIIKAKKIYKVKHINKLKAKYYLKVNHNYLLFVKLRKNKIYITLLSKKLT